MEAALTNLTERLAKLDKKTRHPETQALSTSATYTASDVPSADPASIVPSGSGSEDTAAGSSNIQLIKPTAEVSLSTGTRIVMGISMQIIVSHLHCVAHSFFSTNASIREDFVFQLQCLSYSDAFDECVATLADPCANTTEPINMPVTENVVPLVKDKEEPSGTADHTSPDTTQTPSRRVPFHIPSYECSCVFLIQRNLSM